jgi:hypothetical protein
MLERKWLRFLGAITLFVFVSLGVSSGCNDNNGGGDGVGGPPPEPGQAERTVTITNMCPFPVWIGFVGTIPDGAITQNCPSPNPCPPGQGCNTTASPSHCQWILPPPVTGSFVLGESGHQDDQASFVIPASQAVSDSQVLNVNLYGQTGCDSLPTVCCKGSTPESGCGTQTGCTVGGSDCTQEPGFATCIDPCDFGPCGINCETAPCNSPSRSEPCATGTGPLGPHTQSELNIFMTQSDNYDVSYINGFNIPMEVKPVNGTLDSSNPYHCGNPGSNASITGLMDCTYNFNTTITIQGDTKDFAPYLRNVLPGGDPCTPTDMDPDPTCSQANQVCGLSMSLDLTTLSTTCGEQVGWWSANEVCVQFPSFNEGPFDCQASTGQDTFQNLYGCAGNNASDCYNPGSNSMCCGCPVWTGVTLSPCSNIDDNCCFNTNQTWINLAQPWAMFFKDACSTAFSFPNDDATSDFSCPATVSGTNTVNYEVIYGSVKNYVSKGLVVCHNISFSSS